MPDFERKAKFENVTAEDSTPASLWVRIEGRRVNIPQSQIDDDSEVYRKGDRGQLVISEWIAIEKHLV